ncbi:MAG: CopG family antitoxin [Sphingobium sp.]
MQIFVSRHAATAYGRRAATRVNMRLHAQLPEQVKATAARRGMPYQRFIRQALEQPLHRQSWMTTATIR